MSSRQLERQQDVGPIALSRDVQAERERSVTRGGCSGAGRTHPPSRRREPQRLLRDAQDMLRGMPIYSEHTYRSRDGLEGSTTATIRAT